MMRDYAKIETKEKIKWLDVIFGALILPGICFGALIFQVAMGPK